MLDYSSIRLFDKKGKILPADYAKTADTFFYIKSETGSRHDALLYPVTGVADGSVTFEYMRIDDGGILFADNTARQVDVRSVLTNDVVCTADLKPADYMEINTVDGKMYGLKNIDVKTAPAMSGTGYSIMFPSVKIRSRVNFSPVSAGLFETECVYILNDGGGRWTKIENDGRWGIMGVIDPADAEFRFFSVDTTTEEITYSDSKTVDLSAGECRLDLCFTAAEEGIYEGTMYICLIDKQSNNEPYMVGTVILHGEAVGEDERFRTLLTDFGVPDPKEYIDTLKESSVDESKPDMILLNRKSKQLFLTYPDIFPYTGTYKALVNAVKFMGYDDITFKEWFRTIGTDGQSTYVTYDITYDGGAGPVRTAGIEERSGMRKMNWLSMMYRLNREKDMMSEDGVPDVFNVYDYDGDALMVKLQSLRKWLEKNIIAQNCRIVEVVGEGVYFERYRYDIYGTATESETYDAEMRLSPYVKGGADTRVLKDGTARITVGVREIDNAMTEHDMSLTDLSVRNVGGYDPEGLYIDKAAAAVKKMSDGYDAKKADEGEHIPLDRTFSRPGGVKSIGIKASVSCAEHVFAPPFTDPAKGRMLLKDGELTFITNEWKNRTDPMECVFAVTPDIYVESAVIRDAGKPWRESALYTISEGDGKFIITDKSGKTVAESADYVKIKGGELRYTTANRHGMPMLMCSGMTMTADGADTGLMKAGSEYIIDIRDGRLAWENTVSDHPEFVYLNFSYDAAGGEQDITANFVFTADGMMTDETVYDGDFVKRYLADPDTAFNYRTDFSIDVYKAGEYDVTVTGHDGYGGTFAAAVYPKPVVRSADAAEDYGPAPKWIIQGITTDADADVITYDDISYAVDTPKPGQTLMLMNLGDRFRMSGKAGSYTAERWGSAESQNFGAKTKRIYDGTDTRKYCAVRISVVSQTDGRIMYDLDGFIYANNDGTYTAKVEGTDSGFDEAVSESAGVWIRDNAEYAGTVKGSDTGITFTLDKIGTSSWTEDNTPYKNGQNIRIEADGAAAIYRITGKKPGVLTARGRAPLTADQKAVVNYQSGVIEMMTAGVITADETEDGYCAVFTDGSPAVPFIDGAFSMIVTD